MIVSCHLVRSPRNPFLQNLVVEHHSHIVVGVIHRNALLCADKHESPAKFQQSPQDFVFLFIIGS